MVYGFRSLGEATANSLSAAFRWFLVSTIYNTGNSFLVGALIVPRSTQHNLPSSPRIRQQASLKIRGSTLKRKP